MTIALLCFLYIGIALMYPVYDAYVGLPFDWDTYRYSGGPPPCWAMALFWPISLPIIVLIIFGDRMKNIKNRRQAKEALLERQRILVKREEEITLANLEAELTALQNSAMKKGR